MIWREFHYISISLFSLRLSLTGEIDLGAMCCAGCGGITIACEKLLFIVFSN
jgi:hypothetical protein